MIKRVLHAGKKELLLQIRNHLLYRQLNHNYPRTLQLPTQTGSYSQADISLLSSIPTTSQQLAPTTPPKNTTTKTHLIL